MRRTDFFRASVVNLALAITLGGVGVAFGILSDHFPNQSRANGAAETYMLGCVLLGSVALLSSGIAFWNGVWWKPVPEMRLDEAPQADSHNPG